MRRFTRLMALFSSLVLILVGGPLAATASNAKTTTTKAVSKASAKKTMNETKQSSKKGTSDVLAPPEELNGTISFVGPSDKEVTVLGANGVPYDFDLTKRTRVDLSNQKIAANTLPNQNHKQATVRFVPTARGNVAESIQITAS